MTPIKRPLAAAGAAVLLGLTLTACGGSSYPSDASEKEFCGGFEDIFKVITSIKGDEPTESEWKKIQEAYGDLGDIGTPEKISDAERNGFEVMVDTVTGLDYDEAKKSFGSEDGDDSIPGVSKDDEKDVTKFTDYAQKTCADQFGG